jgi:hypothetical protein
MGGVGTRQFTRRHGRAAVAVALFGFALGGCSSVPSMPSASSMFGSGSSTSAGAQANALAEPSQPMNFECPNVTVRTGASTMSNYANNAEQSPTNLRYQVGIGQTARDCRLNNGIVTMKIGVQGRVILGPQGAPGQIDVPVRLAVVHETPTTSKAITTKLERVSVTVQADSGNAIFTLVDNEISFPLPRGGDIDDYVVYVGFDPQGLEQERRKQPAKPAAPRQRKTT